MYNIVCEMNRQTRFNAWYKMVGVVHWDDPEGWYGEEGGSRVQDGEHKDSRGRFLSMYGKTNTIL